MTNLELSVIPTWFRVWSTFLVLISGLKKEIKTINIIEITNVSILKILKFLKKNIINKVVRINNPRAVRSPVINIKISVKIRIRDINR